MLFQVLTGQGSNVVRRKLRVGIAIGDENIIRFVVWNVHLCNGHAQSIVGIGTFASNLVGKLAGMDGEDDALEAGRLEPFFEPAARVSMVRGLLFEADDHGDAMHFSLLRDGLHRFGDEFFGFFVATDGDNVSNASRLEMLTLVNEVF